jgi:hypothetical protein
MNNEFDNWLKNNAPAGQGWAGRLVALAAAGTATGLVGLSVVMMAGLGLPPGDLPAQAQAQAPGTASVQTAAPASTGPAVRYAQALPTVTIVGRRDSADPPAPVAATRTAGFPARTASADATIGMSATGDNLRQ